MLVPLSSPHLPSAAPPHLPQDVLRIVHVEEGEVPPAAQHAQPPVTGQAELGGLQLLELETEHPGRLVLRQVDMGDERPRGLPVEWSGVQLTAVSTSDKKGQESLMLSSLVGRPDCVILRLSHFLFFRQNRTRRRRMALYNTAASSYCQPEGSQIANNLIYNYPW